MGCEQNHYRRQTVLARNYLASGDYLRAVIMGFEAFITWLVLQEPNQRGSQNHSVRDRVKKIYEDYSRSNLPKYGAYLRLQDLRNALVHGDRSSSAEAQAALISSEQLAAVLEELFNELLPAD